MISHVLWKMECRLEFSYVYFFTSHLCCSEHTCVGEEVGDADNDFKQIIFHELLRLFDHSARGGDNKKET